LVVDPLVVDEVVEQLEAGFGLGLRHHVAGSLHCYHVEFVLIKLVEARVLVPHVPTAPLAHLILVEGVHILLGVGERHHVVPVPTEQPQSHSPVHQNAPVLPH